MVRKYDDHDSRAKMYHPVLGTADMQERGEAQRAGGTVDRSGLTSTTVTTVNGHEAGARREAEAGEYRLTEPVQSDCYVCKNNHSVKVIGVCVKRSLCPAEPE